MTLGDQERFPLYLQAGKWAVPFGGFDTAMSTDPLTKDLGETKEAAVLVGAAWEGLSVEAFLYNGDSQEATSGDHIDQAGVAIGYAGEFDGVELGVGGGYVNNIADSDTLTDTLGANATALNSYVGGIEAHASVGYEGFALLGGYMRATDSLRTRASWRSTARGAQPAAWNVEASYTLPILGKGHDLCRHHAGNQGVLGPEPAREALRCGRDRGSPGAGFGDGRISSRRGLRSFGRRYRKRRAYRNHEVGGRVLAENFTPPAP